MKLNTSYDCEQENNAAQETNYHQKLEVIRYVGVDLPVCNSAQSYLVRTVFPSIATEDVSGCQVADSDAPLEAPLFRGFLSVAENGFECGRLELVHTLALFLERFYAPYK